MLDAAAEMFFFYEKVGEQYRKDFKSLMSHFQNAVGRRNDIAHGMAFRISKEETFLGHFLVPAPYNTNKNEDFHIASDKGLPPNFNVNMLHSYSYTAADILAVNEKFMVLRDLVQAYWAELNNAYPMKP